MTRKEGLAFLTQCADRQGRHWSGGIEWPADECPCCNGTNDSGWLGVPGGRYGTTSRECAPVAWRVAYLYARESGDPITLDDLDHAMSLVVNSSESVAYMVNEYGHGHYT